MNAISAKEADGISGIFLDITFPVFNYHETDYLIKRITEDDATETIANPIIV